jgi:hypothetical protein
MVRVGMDDSRRLEAITVFERTAVPTLPERGLRKGDIGAIVHVHGDSRLGVEFVRASGRTRALLQLAATDVRRAQDEDVPAVRAGTLRGEAQHSESIGLVSA